jgi:hypothetical protein
MCTQEDLKEEPYVDRRMKDGEDDYRYFYDLDRAIAAST